MSKDYTVLESVRRNEWTGNWGTMVDYAVRFEGIDGWVQVTQKPDTEAPQPGDKLYGHTITQTRGDKTFLKFKKEMRDGGGGNFSKSSNSELPAGKQKRMLDLIEAMAREVLPEGHVLLLGRDEVPTDEDLDKPIDLADIPFD